MFLHFVFFALKPPSGGFEPVTRASAGIEGTARPSTPASAARLVGCTTGRLHGGASAVVWQRRESRTAATRRAVSMVLGTGTISLASSHVKRGKDTHGTTGPELGTQVRMLYVGRTDTAHKARVRMLYVGRTHTAHKARFGLARVKWQQPTFEDDQMIRENPASRGTETSAEVLVGPPWRMESNAGPQQWY
jgi:hypothetical protein